MPLDPAGLGAMFAGLDAWYGSDPYRLVQLVYPDRAGWLPWEPGFDPATATVELLLCEVPDGI